MVFGCLHFEIILWMKHQVNNLNAGLVYINYYWGIAKNVMGAMMHKDLQPTRCKRETGIWELPTRIIDLDLFGIISFVRKQFL